MLRKSRRSRFSQSWSARHIPLHKKSLGHTADHFRDPEWHSFGDDIPVRPYPVRSSLIRTVLAERDVPQLPPFRSRPNSPLVAVRASMRSNPKAARSPFFVAQGIQPQLADRAILCAKRGIRREVLFAYRQTGKGSRSPRRSPSKVRC